MADAKPTFISKLEVTKCLCGEWKNLVYLVENALKSYSLGHVVQPVRAAVPVDKHKGVLFAMPAYDKESDSLATKVVSVFPENKKEGTPTINAVVLLYTASTGVLKAIIDGEVITAMRTAAASVVATKYLASKKSENLAILGAGTQARSHYQAFRNFYNFKKISIWNINKHSAETFAEEIRKDGFNVNVFDSAEEAVKEADIIVTVTMATEPLLKKAWIKDGAHINAVGAPVPEWQELEEDLMTSAVLYVDSREGALSESGDIIKSGAQIYAEIGEVVAGKKEAFTEKLTIFKSLGMAVEDVVAAELVYSKFISSK